ncbi:MAG: flavodoxin family protein [Oscillibacter sp.]|nr:flavodoxin family protein [Oscillibacter sp.]
MKKNVFVITGSSRKNGNSAAMAEAFIRGAEEQGHAVRRFDTAFHKLAGCMACDRCWSDEKACVMNDDWQEFAAGLEAADVVVFSYPMYWSSAPAQLKAAIDRLYSYCSAKTLRPLTGKRCILLLCGECEGKEIFDQALAMHQGLNGYFSWEDAGKLLVDGVFEAGAIEKTDALEQAFTMGKGI